MAEDFKPNIYPIMYWGLLYGLVGGFMLILISILSRYIAIVWFPVFLTGVIWGGYRNYLKQKREAGHSRGAGSAMDEFKEAASDIVQATKDMVRDQAEDVIEEDGVEESEFIEQAPAEASEEILAAPNPNAPGRPDSPAVPPAPTEQSPPGERPPG